MNSVQESVYLFQTCFRQSFNLCDSVIDHGCKFLPLIDILFRGQIELVKDNFTDLDDLFVSQLEIFVCYRHFEIRIDQVCQPVDILITDNRW